MEKKRVIFDLDGTLQTADFSNLMDYFERLYGEAGIKLYNDLVTEYLDEYERIFDRYHRVDLSKFLTSRSGLEFTPSMVDDWNDIVSCIPDKVEDGVVPMLERLCLQDKSLVVLTNWFREAQLNRLKRTNLLEYFDELISGEEYLKPHRDAYIAARGGYASSDVVFVGDNLGKDYIGPRACGMDSILYDKNDLQHQNIIKIKKMGELKRRV